MPTIILHEPIMITRFLTRIMFQRANEPTHRRCGDAFHVIFLMGVWGKAQSVTLMMIPCPKLLCHIFEGTLIKP